VEISSGQRIDSLAWRGRPYRDRCHSRVYRLRANNPRGRRGDRPPVHHHRGHHRFCPRSHRWTVRMVPPQSDIRRSANLSSVSIVEGRTRTIFKSEPGYQVIALSLYPNNVYCTHFRLVLLAVGIRDYGENWVHTVQDVVPVEEPLSAIERTPGPFSPDYAPSPNADQ
jgi:hypothetical protein